MAGVFCPDIINSDGQETSGTVQSPPGMRPMLPPLSVPMAGWRSTCLAIVITAGLAVSAFRPSLPNQFVYDDWPIIVHNHLVTDSGPWYRFWTEPWWPRNVSPDKLYRPLASWSFRANMIMTGHDRPSPRPIHIVNIAIHTLTAIGVVLAAGRLTGGPLAGWIAGPLFAVHPINTESVVTGYGRAELMAGMFIAWLLVLYSSRSPARLNSPADKAGSVGPPRSAKPLGGWLPILSTILFLAAIMSKEHALFVWPVLLLTDILRWKAIPAADRPPWRSWLNDTVAPVHIGFLFALVLFLLLRFKVFGWGYVVDTSEWRAWDAPMANIGLTTWLLTPFRLGWITAEMLVWPGRLCPIWAIPATVPARNLETDVWAGIMLFIILVVTMVVSWRRGRLLAVFLAGVFLTLAIPCHVVPITHWLFAERWLYLPTLFIALAAGTVLARLGCLAAYLALAAALVLMPATWQYGRAFADNLTMSREITLRQPNNYQGWRNLSRTLYVQGRYVEAVEAAHEAIERFNENEAFRRQFGQTDAPYWILVKSYLALGDGQHALEALEIYSRLRVGILDTNITNERQQALDIIAAASRPSASTR